MLRMEKSENVDFWHPSHQKSMFLGANGGQDGAQMRIKTDFYTDWIYVWRPESLGSPPPNGMVQICPSATDQIFRWNGIARGDCRYASATRSFSPQ